MARELPDLSAYLGNQGKAPLGKTLMEVEHDEMPRSAMPTPLVPPPEAAEHVVIVPRDPTPAAGSPPRTNVAKTQAMSQTLADPEVERRAREVRDAVLGIAVTAQAPPQSPGLPPQSPGTPAAHASPLSRSVMAPESWSPPAPSAAPEPPAQQPSTAPAVAVARVVSLGPGAAGPGAQPPVLPGGPPRATSSAQGSEDAPARAPALRTMLGMPATELPPGGGAAPSRAPPPGNAQKTMMGVAIPGIAPLRAGSEAPSSMESAPAPLPGAVGGGGPIDLRSKQSTMLGVAIPGIAPSHASPHGAPPPQGHPQQPYPQPQGYPQPPRGGPHVPSQVKNTALGMMAAPEMPIVPRPKTLIDEPLPAAPFIPEKKGIPALAVVGIVALLVTVLGGVVVFFATRSGAPLTAIPQLDENGRESLKIGCVSCPDGTTIALGASSAKIVGGAAILPLPAPLSIGDNNLTVKLDRPGAGRDEDVKVHVPVAYRVRADLATLNAKPPAITVRVEAIPGSEVKVDDKPVSLDATGRGSYSIDLSKETEGTGEAKTFERKIPFVITPKGGVAQPGQLTARTGILSLALDAPGIELFTDKTTAAVAGQTRPGSAVTIDGQNVAVDAQGRFGVRVELATVGDKHLEVIASAPPQAPRIAKVRVVRVASLDAASKELEGHSPMAFDAFGADPASKVGQKAVVEGDVVDVRAAGGHTVMLVDTKRGCAKGATCLVRVVHGDEDKIARGDSVRAYGRVLGSVTASGKTVPELEASLVLPIKAGK